MPDDVPAASVVLVTDTYETVRDVVDHFRAQTVHETVELVLVAPARDSLALPADAAEGLHALRVVEAPIDSLPHARAAAIRAAGAPVVVLGETHSFPDPRFVEELLEAHEGPWAVVGPAMLCANPESMVSWVSLFMDYGPWVESTARGPMDDVPAHNGAYKRDVLLAFGDRLEELLESHTVLNGWLHADGHRLYLESRAKTYHLNVSRLSTCVRERFAAGRVYATSRSEPWPSWRRLLYIAGSPAIPLVRLVRTLGYVRAAGRGELVPRMLPALVIALVASALGELAGYARGSGRATELLEEIELHRTRYAPGGKTA